MNTTQFNSIFETSIDVWIDNNMNIFPEIIVEQN